MGPYAYKGNQWVGFDDVETIRQKSQYVIDHGFGGGMIWALDLDDFNNICGCEKYPLLRTINRVLRNYNAADPHCTLDSNNLGLYESRQEDLILDNEIPYSTYHLKYPASTHPLIQPHAYGGGGGHGEAVVPYLSYPALATNALSYQYAHPYANTNRQQITSYPTVSNASPWAKILYSWG